MTRITCLLCLLSLSLGALGQVQPIGGWREHLPYHQAISVVPGNNEIFAATPYSVFNVDFTDNSIHRFSKMTGLSETGVTGIARDSMTGKWIIAYFNGNLDVLNGNLVKNIPALKESQNIGDKTIYNIYDHNGRAYLSTGIGIVVIDMQRNEVKETYVVGQNGQEIKVSSIASDKNLFYAATVEGLKSAPISSPNLVDYHNWQNEIINGTSSQNITAVTVLSDDHPIILKNDSLYIKQGSNWPLLFADGNRIRSMTKSNNQLIVAETTQTGGRIVVLNENGNVLQVIQNSTFIKNPIQADRIGNDFWIADSTTGLIKFSGGTFTSYSPNSPHSIALGDMQFTDHTLWASAGNVTANWVAQNNKNGVYRFFNNSWDNFNAGNILALDSLPDIISIAFDARISAVWLGSFGGGLMQLKDDRSFTIFKQNSPLQSPPGQPGIYNVSGLALDGNNNLWISNYGSAQQLHVRKADGTWRSFSAPFTLAGNAVAQIVIDAVDQKWIASPGGNGLICYNHGTSIDNPSDDKWKLFRAGLGNGNLPDNNVLSLARDKNGFIWVGTANGIGIIPCIQAVFSNSPCEAILPVVQSGNFNGFLFNGEQVQAIAVDGADRKWIGTRNGVWMISSDGEKTIYHFTEDQSPLLSNDIKKIAIDGTTGEVFFSTAKGICSFRSTATEGTTENQNVLVFPNPVPPGYNGPIAIRGVVENAVVKITELSGRLVYQANALGGQITWNGNDYTGKRVASGIYLVLIADKDRKANLATKIVFLK